MPQLDKFTYFTPILIAFFFSSLVSLILLSLILLFSSKISMDKILTIRNVSFFFPDETSLLNFFFFIFLYSGIYIIPFPRELLAAKLRLLLILGGSSAIFFLVLARSFQSKFLCLSSFCSSTLFVCLCLHKTNVAFIILLVYLTVLFLPIDLVFLSLLIVRAVSFEEWGFALFMQLTFLFFFRKLIVNYSLFIYLFVFWVFTLLIPGDPIFIVKSVLYPLSGALAISFLFLARSGKEHLVTYILYLANGLLICFLFKKTEAACYFGLLNLFLICVSLSITYIIIRKHKKRFSEFPSEFRIFVCKIKQQYLLQFYGVLLLLIPMYSTSDSWMTHWAFSLILQVGFIQF